MMLTEKQKNKIHMPRNFNSDEGSSVLETALVLPLLILMLAVAVDLGRAFSAAIVTTSAAQAGALYGIQHPTDKVGMTAAATLDADRLPTLVPLASYGCECSDGSDPISDCTGEPSCPANSVYYVEVDTTAVYTPLFPYPGLASTFTLRGKARMRASR
jgi:hypothetical protein